MRQGLHIFCTEKVPRYLIEYLPYCMLTTYAKKSSIMHILGDAMSSDR